MPEIPIPPELYMLVFLNEEPDGGGNRWQALPAHRYEEEYEDRLRAYVTQNYPRLQEFSDRHECALDFEVSASMGQSMVILYVKDDEVLALLRLTFENEFTKLVNYGEHIERKRAAHKAQVEKRQREEYEQVKARYFELKAILEPADD